MGDVTIAKLGTFTRYDVVPKRYIDLVLETNFTTYQEARKYSDDHIEKLVSGVFTDIVVIEDLTTGKYFLFTGADSNTSKVLQGLGGFVVKADELLMRKHYSLKGRWEDEVNEYPGEIKHSPGDNWWKQYGWRTDE